MIQLTTGSCCLAITQWFSFPPSLCPCHVPLSASFSVSLSLFLPSLYLSLSVSLSIHLFPSIYDQSLSPSLHYLSLSVESISISPSISLPLFLSPIYPFLYFPFFWVYLSLLFLSFSPSGSWNITIHGLFRSLSHKNIQSHITYVWLWTVKHVTWSDVPLIK